MTYSWNFGPLYVEKAQGELSNVVKSIEYTLSYTDGVEPRYSYYSGKAEFAPADAEAFIEFDEISEEDMISFVEQTLGDELATIMVNLQSSFSSPIELRQLPWLTDNA